MDMSLTLSSFLEVILPLFILGLVSGGVTPKTLEVDEVKKSNNKEVVGLMMFLGNPPKINEHLMMPSHEDCLIKKEIAELTSSALYKCMLVEAEVKDNKIVSIVKEIKIIE